jgi:signal transduction histidine kinase
VLGSRCALSAPSLPVPRPDSRLDLEGSSTGSRREWRLARLLAAVQDLSMTRSLDGVQAIVRSAARELTGADGATFVLRDGDRCYYADEDAIEPLWKGQRFPMSRCISGWVMLNKRPAVIADIYADPRIPADAYRPTFVKSLAMVPIRTADPIGAIGNYWASPHVPDDEELELLQSLANSTSVAIESVYLYQELEQRVEQRTAELAAAHGELEAFSYSVSHDLRAPLRSIDGFAEATLEDCGDALGDVGRQHLGRVRAATKRMSQLIDDLLGLSRVTRAPLDRVPLDLGELAAQVAAAVGEGDPDRDATWVIAPGVIVDGDRGLLRVLLENLLGNAWKFTRGRPSTRIEVGTLPGDGETVYFVRDNGAGFDMRYAGKLFSPFQRLHDAAQFPGTGIGLATVQRVVRRHGGRIWAEAEVDGGATFYWTLAAPRPA